MEFKKFSAAVSKQFAKMIKDGKNLYRTSVEKDAMWNTYLNSFPEGTNPIYKTRTEHDCNCCKQFIRAVGDVVTIINNKVVSIWDTDVKDPTYQIVSDAMAALVKSFPVENEFFHFEAKVGKEQTLANATEGVITWNHFHVTIPAQFVQKNDDIAAILSSSRATYDVFKRGLETITKESVETVLELIAQKSLYRGEEHVTTLKSFQTVMRQHEKIKDDEKNQFYWDQSRQLSGNITRIRNTVIGTLLIDLSEGTEIEAAVKMFESKVAPANYKRPTALVTKGMIEKAKRTIEELGLGSALERRYATLEDITANNILYANRSARKSMNADVFDDLIASASVNLKTFDKVEEVGIDKFLSDILPKVKTIEMMVENRHISNLVSLVAPADATANPLFKWGNPFSWSYNGDVADSLRQRVANAGGRVDGVLRFSHSWNHVGRNASLMDLHVFMPGSKPHADGVHDGYPGAERVGWNKRKHNASGGVQDVDYIAAAPEGYVPVENITFPSLSKLKEGKYVFKIHNWCLRQPTTSGFKAEIEFEGQVFEYEMARPLRNKEWVTVAEATLKNGKFEIEHKIPCGSSQRTVWGMTTNTFQPVNVVMHSPNYWDEKVVGNKHFFFMLENCKNEGVARGFFNEFLKEELNPHRKVIEMVGAKLRTEKSEAQLSGLGFSSTQRNSALVKVNGAFSRVIKLVF